MGATVITPPSGAIPDGSVTLAKMADLASAGLIGRTSAGAPQIVSAADVAAFLPASSIAQAQISSGVVTATINATNNHPASLNLSTEGTFDWVHLGTSSPIIPRIQTTGGVHAKSGGSGGWLLHSFDWHQGGATGWGTISQAGVCTMSTTLTDDLHTAALSSNLRVGFFTATANSINSGWRFRAPCIPGPSDLSGARRRIRIYAQSFNSALTVTVRSSDGSLTPITAVSGASGGGSVSKIHEIVYVGPPGTEIIVEGNITASSTNPNQTLSGITIESLS